MADGSRGRGDEAWGGEWRPALAINSSHTRHRGRGDEAWGGEWRPTLAINSSHTRAIVARMAMAKETSRAMTVCASRQQGRAGRKRGVRRPRALNSCYCKLPHGPQQRGLWTCRLFARSFSLRGPPPTQCRRLLRWQRPVRRAMRRSMRFHLCKVQVQNSGSDLFAFGSDNRCDSI